MAAIAEFCRRWQITELSLFGSVLRDDFRPDSDVDVLVTFAPDHGLTFFDLAQMERELQEIIGRPVDLVERATVEQSPNFIRRNAILTTVQTIYAVG
ncbi:MAG: nucleotidyltransferase family protein [Dehalococcoidia bacterium]